MGDPDFSFGFSRILEAMLKHEFPKQKFEIVNTAITAINSNVVLPIARDCADAHPDLFIVYLGNNEVIGPYGPGTVFAPFMSNLAFVRSNIFLKSTKIGQLTYNIGQSFAKSKPGDQTWGGVDMFLNNRLRFNDPRMKDVYDHFHQNLQEICQTGTDAGAKVILSTVATNLKNCAPFGSLHENSIQEKSLKYWQKKYDSAIQFESEREFDQAIEGYHDAAKIDTSYADLNFRLARCFLALGQIQEAHTAFEKARDLDALRFRADIKINQIIRDISETSTDITLVDAEKTFWNSDSQTIPGDNVFYDHVHFNFAGNYKLAKLIRNEVRRIFTQKNTDSTLSIEAAKKHLAFTPFDDFRLKKEMLTRKKSPAFAHQLDNQEVVEQEHTALETLRKTLTQDALTQSIQIYQKAIAAEPNDWILHNNLGLLLLENGHDSESAIKEFEFVQTLFPEDHVTQNNMGLAYKQLGEYETAIVYFEKALQVKPTYFEAYFNLGETFEKQGAYEAALDNYQRAHVPNEKLAEAYKRYGIYLANSGKIDRAVEQLNLALDSWPKCAEAHRALGRIYVQIQNLESAVHHFSEQIRLQPNQAEGFIDLGSTLFQTKDFAGAIANYQSALQINPDLPEVENNLGLAFCNLGQFEAALPHFENAIKTEPDYLAARNNMAGALSQLGENEAAIKQLEAIQELNPDNPQIHNNIGAELLKLGRTKQAIAHFEKALQINPNMQSARKNLSYALSKLKEN